MATPDFKSHKKSSCCRESSNYETAIHNQELAVVCNDSPSRGFRNAMVSSIKEGDRHLHAAGRNNFYNQYYRQPQSCQPPFTGSSPKGQTTGLFLAASCGAKIQQKPTHPKP